MHLGKSPHPYVTTLVNMCKRRAQVFRDKRHSETPRVLGCIIAMINIVYVIRVLDSVTPMGKTMEWENAALSPNN